MALDYYQVLAVGVDATQPEIKQAYRRRLRETHPDTGGSAEEFREVQAAWETLSDEGKKRVYDAGFGRVKGRTTPSQSFRPNLDFETFATQFANDYMAAAHVAAEESIRRIQEEQAAAAAEQDALTNEALYLAQPFWPLYNTRWGLWAGQSYAAARINGTPFERVNRWRRIDMWALRGALGLAAMIVALVFLFGSASASGQGVNMVDLIVGAFFPAIGVLLLTCGVIFGLQTYRHIRYVFLAPWANRPES